MPRLDPKDFMFSKKNGETLTKNPGQINGQQFIIEDLNDCEVVVADHTAQVTVDVCKRSRMFIGPCNGSVFVRDCEDCEFTVACRQFRTRNLTRCKINLYVMTDPIIELSSELVFRPFNGAYDGLQAHMKAAELVASTGSPHPNKFESIYDFNDNDTDCGVRPHYHVHKESAPLWSLGNSQETLFGKAAPPHPKQDDSPQKSTPTPTKAVEKHPEKQAENHRETPKQPAKTNSNISAFVVVAGVVAVVAVVLFVSKPHFLKKFV